MRLLPVSQYYDEHLRLWWSLPYVHRNTNEVWSCCSTARQWHRSLHDHLEEVSQQCRVHIREPIWLIICMVAMLTDLRRYCGNVTGIAAFYAIFDAGLARRLPFITLLHFVNM